jgi:hypothetical protein
VAKRKRKPRTPAPPRRPGGDGAGQRVQAPKVRKKTTSSEERARRQRLLLYGLGGSGLIALAVVVIVIFAAGGGGGSDKQVLGDSCTQSQFPLLNGTHVTSLKAKVKWDSFPPSSGPHYVSPAPWNFYEQRINPRITLHNLEHGGVDVFYGSKIPSAQVEQIRTFWLDDPNGMIVAPMPKRDANIKAPPSQPDLDRKVVLAAWTATPYASGTRQKTSGNGFLVTCRRYDEKTLSSFVKIHRGKGPERFPVSSLTPGT